MLVIYRGIQLESGRLPAGVEASECVPADAWFAENARPPRVTPPAKAERAKRREK